MTAPKQAGGIEVRPVPIQWHEGLPIFASEPFLCSVGDEYGWIGGFGKTGELRCVLPFTVIKKIGIRLVRFRVETIPLCPDFSVSEEEDFLDRAVDYLKGLRADVIIPATTNSVFRAIPRGAIAVPYATYVIDLTQSEDDIWRQINHTYRKDIQNAGKKGLQVQVNSADWEDVYAVIRRTFKRSGIPFMAFSAFEKLLSGLGEHARIFTAEQDGIIQSAAVYPFSQYCAYGVYGGSLEHARPGAFKLIQWEAMKSFRNAGVRRYDLVGARVRPEPGSRQEGIMLFKQHFGAQMLQGHIWKYPITRWKYWIYQWASRVRKGGDIVDQELRRLGF